MVLLWLVDVSASQGFVDAVEDLRVLVLQVVQGVVLDVVRVCYVQL